MPGKPGSLGIYYLLDYSPEGIGKGLIRASGGFQAMIDACGQSGGGLCAVPAGLYNLDATPTWRTWSNITIWVHSGAVFTGPGGLPANAGSNVVRTEPSAAVVGGAPVTQGFGDAPAAGVSGTAAAADHRHGMPNSEIGAAAAVTQAFGDAPAAGVATVGARSDHRHGMPGVGSVGTAQLAANAVTQLGSAVGSTSGPTTTSTTFVDLPDMVVTLNTNGGDLIVTLVATLVNSLANAATQAALALDGAAEVSIQTIWSTTATFGTTVVCRARFTGVAAGSHTIKGRWLANSGTATAVLAERTLDVMEVKR